MKKGRMRQRKRNKERDRKKQKDRQKRNEREKPRLTKSKPETQGGENKNKK